MAWQITENVDEFLAAAGDFLRQNPVENTVLLTAAESVRRSGTGTGSALFGWAADAVFLHTPPFPALLSAMPADAAIALADALEGPLPGVTGPEAAVEAFAAEWQRRTGCSASVSKRMRLFRLGTLVLPPRMPVGAARVAVAADRAVLLDWTGEFFHEVGEITDIGAFVDDRIAYGGYVFWEVDGKPVAMASATRPDSGMVRIQAVYTPKENRSHGYAAAATHAISRLFLDGGVTEVLLFTDLANPTANALYPRIGYVPLWDRTTMEFTS
ncbi:GNAT family N-acetyltransferase [Winogradskya humida]|uniref:N-acetyltransferase n=1 Tax=Winogradskya humida TaxID=113566 RepID=A0ABQ3ZKX1_9ACTN|nr:GNAT family N-acetyltransferase [Actinoplanes humidus]GIE19202.1 N-acetyltransferase [Actinoplanes humidus]